MITQEEGKGFSSSTKQESNNKNITNFIVSSRPSSSSTISSSSWSRSKDLRVVRVSKALGGKDRHSKVCTVRGLKDRRVRLSVETAIQLYDLQERLGLNQPSKVVDWLLNQAKQEIDELPPLQIPPPGLNFPQNLDYSMIMSANSTSASSSSNHQVAVDRAKEIKDEKSRNEMDNLNLESRHHHQRSGYASLLSTSDLLQKLSNINPSRVQFLMNRNSLDNSSLLRWDPSNLSLSHHHHHHQPEDNDDHQHFQNFNNNCVVPLQPSTFNDSTPSGPHLGVPHYPSQSYFDLQMLSSNSHNSLSSNSLSQSHVESSTYRQQEVPPPVRPFRLANFLCSASDLNIGNETNKDDGQD